MFSKVLQIKAMQWNILNNTYFKNGVELLPCYGADAILVKTPEDVKEKVENEKVGRCTPPHGPNRMGGK